MKLKLLLGALVGAAVLTVPTAAHAGQYDPVTASDPSHDEEAGEPASGGIDIVSLRGARTAKEFTISVGYRNFRAVDASRRYAGLVDPRTNKGRVLEYRTTPAGKVQTAFYKITVFDGGSRIVPVKCAGATTKVDRARDRLVSRMPASCYPGRSGDGALLLGGAAAWTRQTWTPGPLTTGVFGNPPEQGEEVQTSWLWSPGAPPRTPAPHLHLF